MLQMETRQLFACAACMASYETGNQAPATATGRFSCSEQLQQMHGYESVGTASQLG